MKQFTLQEQQLNLQEQEDNIAAAREVGIAKNVLQQEGLYLQRSSGCDKGDSGWYIGPINEEVSGELETIYAYELLKMKPAIIQVLALPYNYLVVFEKDEIKSILNESDIDIWSEIER
ncbi:MULTISPECIES: immunity protein Imm33 domain-containing protein [Bacillus cereus group]|uniref:immunity protein Imm33 domain-containing protein n=1 Tax=Bacillus cereus group TaxID=86661 RepID=UPI0001A203B8|nr:hypothetical protein bthur0011_26810 [Bacillus thuringiensis serovar huazhongensis BGSC 4BD1]KLA26940.1 hypothetical protein B4080_3012 [Bacillus cereus]PNK38800.1 hypothetical protein CBR55_10820 [Bacillus thuringiensis]